MAETMEEWKKIDTKLWNKKTYNKPMYQISAKLSEIYKQLLRQSVKKKKKHFMCSDGKSIKESKSSQFLLPRYEEHH